MLDERLTAVLPEFFHKYIQDVTWDEFKKIANVDDLLMIVDSKDRSKTLLFCKQTLPTYFPNGKNLFSDYFEDEKGIWRASMLYLMVDNHGVIDLSGPHVFFKNNKDYYSFTDVLLFSEILKLAHEGKIKGGDPKVLDLSCSRCHGLENIAEIMELFNALPSSCATLNLRCNHIGLQTSFDSLVEEDQKNTLLLLDLIAIAKKRNGRVILTGNPLINYANASFLVDHEVFHDTVIWLPKQWLNSDGWRHMLRDVVENDQSKYASIDIEEIINKVVASHSTYYGVISQSATRK